MCDEQHGAEGAHLCVEGTIQTFVISDDPCAGTGGWVTPGK